MDLQKLLFDAGRSVVSLGDRQAANMLEAVKHVVSASLNWSADQIDRVVERQIIERLVVGLRSSGEAIRRADLASSEGLTIAIRSTANALRAAINALDIADDYTRKTVLENVHLASIVGSSFAGVRLCDISPSFRAEGRDVSPEEMAALFHASGLRRAIVCVPGLLSDETLWTNSQGPCSIDQTLADLGIYLIRMRFNPGAHISDNGKALLSMMSALLRALDGHASEGSNPGQRPQATKIDVITFSLGGLILRSALYLAREQSNSLASRLHKAILINSPDGGSYLEKLGFVVGTGLEHSYLPLLHLIGLVGNQRSAAIRDLSHGIIREEDWKNEEHFVRYRSPRYFGELDDVDAFQVYSLIHPGHEYWKSWVGDGIVETPSLMLLSDLYRKKGLADDRVRVVHGRSHFQVLHDPETCSFVSTVLS